MWGAGRDSVRILRDPDYSAGRRAGWLVRNPAYHAAQWSSRRRASHADLGDDAALARHSLEAERTR
jgi:hypothetical protein